MDAHHFFCSWFLEQLRAVDRSVTPWLVVSLHRYFYSTQVDDSGKNIAISEYLRANLEPLLHEVT